MTAMLRLALVAAAFAPTSVAESMLASDGPPLSMTPEVTGSGCICDGKCGATVTTGNAACDWCWTKNKCGKNIPLRGHWDYCVYPKMDSYEAQSYKQKEDQLWNNIMAKGNIGKSGPMPALPDVKTVLTESMITVFDDHWDVLPEGRHKGIHAQGALCKVDLDVTSQEYTGLFSSGKAQGIARMGSATNAGTAIGILPGLSLKFLRSGIKSANFVALAPAPTTKNYNYFWRSLSNIVAPAKALQITGKFQQATGCINQVGLSDVCQYSEDGQMSEVTKFPYEIMFEHTGQGFSSEKTSAAELIESLSSISAGVKLFDVYTHSSPTAKKQGKKEKLGTLTTTSQCVQSLFGDAALFFRHQRMEEDFALRPDWIASAGSNGCKPSNKPISTWQCAFKETTLAANQSTGVIV